MTLYRPYPHIVRHDGIWYRVTSRFEIAWKFNFRAMWRVNELDQNQTERLFDKLRAEKKV